MVISVIHGVQTVNGSAHTGPVNQGKNSGILKGFFKALKNL